MKRSQGMRAIVVLALLAGVLQAAQAQDYPAKPVRIIVGFPSGGVTDLVSRIIARKLSENLGQQFIVDNRPGGGSVIASEITARATPDGYTLSMISTSFAINAGFYQKLPYDPLKDFAAVSLASSAPQVLVANLLLPVKSVADLISLARARPGQLNFASSGTSSTSHLAGELLKSMANIDLTHVPYKGGAAVMMPDVISGRVQLSFLSLPGTLPQIKAGKVRAIAVTSTKRSNVAPDVPTFAESGVPGYEATSWSGIVTPAAAPAQLVARLNSEIVRVLRSPDVIDAINRQGAEPLGSTQAEFDAYLKGEVTKWKKLIGTLGLQLNG